MKIGKRYIVLGLTILVLTGSCRSKKKTTQLSPRPSKELVVKHEDTELGKPIPQPKSLGNATLDYIARYSDVAKTEMQKFKIPASITLAQGILESSSGRSELTRKSNNHFGIKCHKGWSGKKAYHDDDKNGECFRVYRDPRTSFRDHSLFLTGRDRYEKLFKLRQNDFEGWAKGLSSAGYATDRRYPAKLIAIIEKYDLHRYDNEVLGKKYKAPKRAISKIHIVRKGDTLYSIAKSYGISVADLKSLNRLPSNLISIGQELVVKKK